MDIVLTSFLTRMKSQKNIQKLFDLYRIVVWILTSIAYLYRNDGSEIWLKAIVSVLIGMSSVGIIRLYSQRNLKIKQILAIVTIDFWGSLLILLPTGGLYSPFVWYAITPIMMSMLHMKYIRCIEMTIMYYLFALGITHIYFNPKGLSIGNLIISSYETIMVLLLIGAAMGCWKSYFKLLIDVNEKLNRSNVLQQKLNEMLDSTLEEIIYIGSTKEYKTSKDEMNKEHEVMIENLNSAMNINGIYKFKYKEQNLSHGIYLINEDIVKYGMEAEIKSRNSRGKRVEVREKDLLGQEHVLGCFLAKIEDGDVERLFRKKLKFMLKFMINEENRIRFQQEINEQKNIEIKNKVADELHDHLSQRVFNLSCSVFELKQNLFQKNVDQIQREIDVLEESIRNVVLEVRATITNLSSIKSGEEKVNKRIQSYIKEIEFFNDVKINLEISRYFDSLETEYKKILYRIFCETIGNSVRHGKAEHIDVSFTMNKEAVVYKIKDDGRGFDVKAIKKRRHRGLGLRNLEKLTKLLNGIITIESSRRMGTKIEVSFPRTIKEAI